MDTGQMIAQRIEAIIAERGTNPRAVALSAGMSATGVRDIILRKTKNPTFASLAKIAEVLGVPVTDIIEGTTPPPSIAVPGRAGAGAVVHLVDDHTKGDGLYHVECPPQLSPHGVVAVEVTGDSMEPVYSEGDLLFFSRDVLGVPDDAIGRKCVCEDESGQCWIKQVKVGTSAGLFNLLSLNPTGVNMHNIKLKWAAPVKLHLPRELVKKI